MAMGTTRKRVAATSRWVVGARAVCIAACSLMNGCSRQEGDARTWQQTTEPHAKVFVDFNDPKTRLEIYRNNVQRGPDDDCLTTFTIAEAQRGPQSALCGMSEATVPRVTWRYLSHTRDQVTFQFTYEPPAGQSETAREEKTIVFAGAPVVVFENKISRATLRL